MISAKWIIAIDMQYYPFIECYPDEATAREAYEQALKVYGSADVVYLAQVLEVQPGQHGEV